MHEAKFLGLCKLFLGGLLYILLTFWLLGTVSSVSQPRIATVDGLTLPCTQPFIEPDQSILLLLPRPEIAVLFISFLIVILCCFVCGVVGLQLLTS